MKHTIQKTLVVVLAIAAAFLGGYDLHNSPRPIVVKRVVKIVHPTCAGDHDGDCGEPDNDGN